MTEDFYAAAIPEQRFVLGLALKPLSVGHIILLHRIKSAFVCGDTFPDYEDLVCSALVCSLSYEDALEVIEDPDTPKVLKRWADKLTGNREWLVRFGFKLPRVIDLKAHCEVMANYIAEQSKLPHYSYAPGDFKEQSCPSVQLVKVTLMRDMKFTDSEILNRSWILCLWDYITLKALKGEVRMVDKEKIDDALEVAERLAQLVKEGKIKHNGH